MSPPLTDGEAVPDPVGEALTTGIGATVVPQGLQGKIRTIFFEEIYPKREGIQKENWHIKMDVARYGNRIEEARIQIDIVLQGVAPYNIRRAGKGVCW